jgi:hypothetical protein
LKSIRFILSAIGPIVFCLASFTSQAHATVFEASGLFADGAALGGTLTIDTNAGKVSSSDLTISGAGTFSTLVFQFNFGFPVFYSVIVDDSAGTKEFSFGLLTNNLVGYTGGDFCSDSNGGCLTSVYYPTSAPLDEVRLSTGILIGPSGVAPEPEMLSFWGTAFAVGFFLYPSVRERIR